MTFPSTLRSLFLSLCAFCALAIALPVQAQQRVERIQIGDLLQRIDRLETDVARLRVAPRPGGGGDIARLDQIEQELRRLTGIIERLEFDTRRAATATDKRLDGLDNRLSAVEADRASAPPSSMQTTQHSFPPPPPALPSQGTPIMGIAPPFGAPGNFDQQIMVQPQQSQTGFPVASAPFAPGFAPQGSPVGVQNPAALYDEGLRLLNVGQFDQAGARFEDLIATYPQDPKAGQAQFWLGDMHFKLGRYEQAAAAFLDSFRTWPEGEKAPDSLLKLGMTLASIGKTEEACLSFKQVPARYPGASPTLLRRADIESQRYRCS